MARTWRALIFSVLVASVIEAILCLLHKWPHGQVCNNALTPDKQQCEVPGSTDDSKNSTSAH